MVLCSKLNCLRLRCAGGHARRPIEVHTTLGLLDHALLTTVASEDQHPGHRESRHAEDSDTSGQEVVEGQPVQIGRSELLDHQNADRARIAYGVDRGDEETDISPDLEAGDKAVEEDGLKSEVGHIETEALDKEPDHGTQPHDIVAERNDRHHRRPERHHHQQDGECPNVAPHQRHQGKEHQDNPRHDAVQLGEEPRRMARRVEDIDQKVLLHVAQHQQQQVGHEQQRQNRHELTIDTPTAPTVHHDAFALLPDILFAGLGHPAEGPRQQAEQRKGDPADDGRHPEGVDPEVVHREKAQRLGRTGADHDADSQQAGQQVGQPTTFDEAEDHAPHAAQRQTVEEHGKHVPRPREQTEQHQRQLGHQPHRGDEGEAPGSFEFGDDFDSGEFGDQIADNLSDGHGDLVVDTEDFETVEPGGGVGFAQGVNQRITKQRGTSAPKDEQCIGHQAAAAKLACGHSVFIASFFDVTKLFRPCYAHVSTALSLPEL